MPDAHANFAVSQVAVAPSPALSGTSLTVQTGHGARFPTPPFNAPVSPSGVLPTPLNAEIVRVTQIVGDVLTIARTQEGSSARAITVGDQIFAGITAKTLTDADFDLRNPGGGPNLVDVYANPGDLVWVSGNGRTVYLPNAPQYGSKVGVLFSGTASQYATVATQGTDAVYSSVNGSRVYNGVAVFIYMPTGGGGGQWLRLSDTATPDQSAWTAYAPAWTTSNGSYQPALGSGGSIAGAYKQIGKTCLVRIMAVFGTGPNGGRGYISFSLPVLPVSGVEFVLPARLYVTSSGMYFGQLDVSGGLNAGLWVPTQSGNCILVPCQSSDATGSAGTGAPLIAGGYPVQSNGNVAISGAYETA